MISINPRIVVAFLVGMIIGVIVTAAKLDGGSDRHVLLDATSGIAGRIRFARPWSVTPICVVQASRTDLSYMCVTP